MTPSFTEQWYPPHDAIALAAFAAEANDVPGGFLELGSFEGRSALLLRDAFPTRSILCVDAWPDAATYARFLSNVEGRSIAHLRCTWEEFKRSPECLPLPVALIHIDMDHGYEQVADQIRWAAAAVAPGGVIVGHDYNRADWPEVVRAVDELLPGRRVMAAVWAA